MTTTTQDSITAVLGRMRDAVVRADMDALRACFSTDAVVWHNNDGVEQDVDTFTAVLAGLCSVSTRRAYEDPRDTIVGRTAFLQHVLTADLHGGSVFTLPAMMRVEIGDEGLIVRIEEYFDSAALAPLAAAAG